MEEFPCEMDICKVCHQEGNPEQPLIHPCLCAGSIKYIHEKCLLEWMNRRAIPNCALCKHHYSFTPIYAPDMPSRLSFIEITCCVTSNLLTGIINGLHLIVVLMLWLCIFPIIHCRVRRCLFNNSFDAMISLLLDMWSPITLFTDMLYGYLIIMFIVLAVYSMKKLLNQIYANFPDWVLQEEPNDVIIVYEFLPFDFEENSDEETHEENIEGNEDDLNPDEQWDTVNFKKLLGFDGSFKFLQFLFLVLFVNATFIFAFEYVPYKLGFFTLNVMNLLDKLGCSHFESFLAFLCGYCQTSIFLLIMYTISSVLRLKFQCELGISYIFVKAFLICNLEDIMIPIALGWWLDICSLSMFDTNLNDLLTRFHSAPYYSICIHWILFKVFSCYLKWFIERTPRAIRLCISRSLKIKNYENGFQKNIKGSMWQIGRSLIVLVLMLGAAIFCTVWIPLQILKCMWPSFSTWHVTLNIDLGYSFYIIEMLFLFFIFLLIQNMRIQKHNKINRAIRFWFKCISDLLSVKLNLTRYELEQLNFRNVQPYTQPTCFMVYLILLLVVALLSLIIINLSVIIIPVLLGHLIMIIIMTGLSQFPILNELCYEVGVTIIIFLIVKVFCPLVEPDRHLIINIIKYLIFVCFKTIAAFFVLISLLLSILFLRSPLDVPLFINDNSITFLIARCVYLTLMPIIIMLTLSIIKMEIMSVYRQLYKYVMDKKYLVGKRIENYNHTNTVSL